MAPRTGKSPPKKPWPRGWSARLRTSSTGPAAGIGRQRNSPPGERVGVKQMQRAGIVGHAGDGANCQQRRETTDRQRQCAEHAQFGTIVAFGTVERVANEAAEAWFAAKQADLPLELNGGRRNQRDA